MLLINMMYSHKKYNFTETIYNLDIKVHTLNTDNLPVTKLPGFA